MYLCIWDWEYIRYVRECVSHAYNYEVQINEFISTYQHIIRNVTNLRLPIEVFKHVWVVLVALCHTGEPV